MTTGYICDRCGETFTGGGWWLQGGRYGSAAKAQRWDLCPDCMEDFTGWMERGQIADMSAKSADCVRDGDAVSDFRESVRERRYDSQDVTGDIERVTDSPEMLHDTREKLEEDVRTYMFPWRVDMAIDWLDRQASITEAECERVCDTCDWPSLAAQPDQEAYDRIAKLEAQMDALTTERDNLRIYRDTWEHTAHLHEGDIERLIVERDNLIAEHERIVQEMVDANTRQCERTNELTAERDHWKDAFEDSERLRLELIKELEKRDKGIRRLKQRRGELMEQVRMLQDDAARARREA